MPETITDTEIKLVKWFERFLTPVLSVSVISLFAWGFSLNDKVNALDGGVAGAANIAYDNKQKIQIVDTNVQILQGQVMVIDINQKNAERAAQERDKAQEQRDKKQSEEIGESRQDIKQILEILRQR